MTTNEQSSEKLETKSPCEIIDELLNKIEKLENQNSSTINQNEVIMTLTKRIENVEKISVILLDEFTNEHFQRDDEIKLLNENIKTMDKNLNELIGKWNTHCINKNNKNMINN